MTILLQPQIHTIRVWTTLARAILILIFMLLTLSIPADGKIIPAVGMESMPEIPAQSGVILYEDNVQTLLIDTSVTLPDQRYTSSSYAWLIPLPAPPLAIEPATLGVFKTIRRASAPVVDGDDFFPLFVGAVVVAWFAFMTASMSRSSPRGRGCLILFNAAFLPVVAAILVPNFLGAGPPLASEASLLSRQRVGAYDTAVIRAPEAEAVERWLDQNGFRRLPASAREAVSAYCREGWVFVASRLHPLSREASPHPVALTFPADSPIYPMRLTTAGADLPLQLDLYLLAPSPAKVKGMEVRFRGKFQRDDDRYWRRGRSIGHPFVLERLNQPMWLTHLRSTFKPGEIDQDIKFSFIAAQDAGKSAESLTVVSTTYTDKAARARQCLVFMLGLALLIPIGTAAYKSGGRRSGSTVVLVGLAVIFAGAISYGGLLSRIPAQSITFPRSFSPFDLLRRLSSSRNWSSTLAELEKANGGSTETLAVSLREMVEKQITPDLDVRGYGDGPGEWQVSQDWDNEWVLVFRDDSARPFSIRFTELDKLRQTHEPKDHMSSGPAVQVATPASPRI